MRCPDCHGEGGDWNVVLWWGPGGGEWIDCGYCDENGTVSIRRWLYWYLVVILWEEKIAPRLSTAL